jgi:type II restriction/modification system DNA methylase subunit YeeA
MVNNTPLICLVITRLDGYAAAWNSRFFGKIHFSGAKTQGFYQLLPAFFELLTNKDSETGGFVKKTGSGKSENKLLTFEYYYGNVAFL